MVRLDRLYCTCHDLEESFGAGRVILFEVKIDDRSTSYCSTRAAAPPFIATIGERSSAEAALNGLNDRSNESGTPSTRRLLCPF